MLKSADIDLNAFLPTFAKIGASVAFISPTETGLQKSIMDAIGSVRTLLKDAGIHDYEIQQQGTEHKVVSRAFFVRNGELQETTASLYRPVTKHGDPRIWFSKLKSYANAHNLLALFVIGHDIYVLNLSNVQLASSLLNHGYVYDVVCESVHEQLSIAKELLQKIWTIHNNGFLPSITPGDPGVGDTLENALGISRNNLKLPDYKGIELKATRLTRNGGKRSATRSNLFAKVPDEGMTYSEIVRAYGRWTYNEKKNEHRLALENTTFASKTNSFGLQLQVDEKNEHLNMLHVDGSSNRLLSYWYMTELRKTLLQKHHETFWVQATSENRDGKEWFRYDKIVHTKNPNVSLLEGLIETDKIMVDLAGYFSKEKDMKWRDHGMLFKMWPTDLPLLFGEQEYIDLESLVL